MCAWFNYNTRLSVYTCRFHLRTVCYDGTNQGQLPTMHELTLIVYRPIRYCFLSSLYGCKLPSAIFWDWGSVRTPESQASDHPPGWKREMRCNPLSQHSQHQNEQENLNGPNWDATTTDKGLSVRHKEVSFKQVLAGWGREKKKKKGGKFCSRPPQLSTNPRDCPPQDEFRNQNQLRRVETGTQNSPGRRCRRAGWFNPLCP